MLITIAFAILASSCTTAGKKTASPLLPYCEGGQQVKMAILPFENYSSHPDAAAMIRNNFYRALSTAKLEDIELWKIDSILDSKGIFTTDDIKKLTPQELGKMLGADLILFGAVKRQDALYMVLYSVVTVEVEINIVDAATGNTVWKSARSLKNIGGTFPTVPFEWASLFPSPITSLISLSKKSFELTSWELCSSIAGEMTDGIK
ncbi:MAG: DUF799 family lipoprotein [Candidatus Schekmanbacteria bacterium]|nr:DUF799 family lipoprotein [Candidatus Schekmanbacteria bacterium]